MLERYQGLLNEYISVQEEKTGHKLMQKTLEVMKNNLKILRKRKEEYYG